MKFTPGPSKQTRFIPLAISLVLGIAVATTGWILVDRAEDQVTTKFTNENNDKLRVARSLLQGTLRIGSAGVRELTSLPLLSDYLEIAVTGPNTIDAEELKLYLQEVLLITYGELGADALVAVDRNGTIHLKLPADFSDAIPDTFSESGAFLVNPADGPAELWWRQRVPGYENPDNEAGALYLKFPAEAIAEIKQAGLSLEMATDNSETDKPGNTITESNIRIVANANPATVDLLLLRLFSLAVGIMVFVGLAWRLQAVLNPTSEN